MNPVVSVIVPTFRRPDLVPRAVTSALAQTVRAIEVIVVVDGRDRETVAVLAQFRDSRLHVVVPPRHLGNADARNVGVEHARARWVAFLDDDDEWMPVKLERQLAAAAGAVCARPVVTARMLARSEDGDRLWPRRAIRDGEHWSEYFFCRRTPFTGEGMVILSGLLAPRALLSDVPFTSGLPRHVDPDWLLRVSQADGVCLVLPPGDDPLLVWNIERGRRRITTERDWERSLSWCRAQRGLFTSRGYAAFVLHVVGSNAAAQGAYGAFFSVLREAIASGRSGAGRPGLPRGELHAAAVRPAAPGWGVRAVGCGAAMKVLLLQDYGVLAGGAERIAVDLRDGLRTRGHQVRLFASTASPIPLDNVADDTCYGTNAWPQRLLQIVNPSAVRQLRALLQRFQPDLVHVRMFLTQLSPAILPLLEGRAAILHVGNQQTICPINTRLLPDGSRCTFRAGAVCHQQGCVSLAGLARTLLQLRTWRRHQHVFRRIVANSEAVAAALRENDVPVSEVVRNGTKVVAARAALTSVPTILYAGRLVEQKGVDVLLDAMTVVKQRVPGVQLIVAGDGPDRGRIETLIRQNGLADVVDLCGHLTRPVLDTALANAWVQVVPSRYPEPSANVIPEAMMRGIAVVGTAIGGTPELVRDGVTGFLVPPRDPAALAQRLIAVLDDRALTERMGAAAREVALADLTTDRMVDRFERIYATLAG